MPAASRVTSSNTFTIQVDRTIPFDSSKLQSTFQTTEAPPVANPGPNQTVGVGCTVTLDGSGSTNPSGIGTLTYSWMFISRPPGTATRLFYEDTVPMAMFLADAPGVFVTQLTVGNGTAKSSASVTVTAVVGAPCSASLPMIISVSPNTGQLSESRAIEDEPGTAL